MAAPSVATRENDVVGAEIEIFGGLDRRQHVAQGRQAEIAEPRHQLGVDAAAFDQVFAPDLGIEQHEQRVGRLVADAGHHVGVHDVVDIGNVLVADALDIVLAEAVIEQRRAFDRLDRDDAWRRTAP